MYNKTSDNIKHIFLSSKTFLNFVSLLINYILKMYIKRKYRQGGSELLRITLHFDPDSGRNHSQGYISV